MEKWKVSQICEKERSRRLLPLSLYPDVSNYAKGRFHSLQTGKCIASDCEDPRGNEVLEFPFPSNGKVHRKLQTLDVLQSKLSFPFPSNGKVHRKTKGKSQTAAKLRDIGFHSLQTGKCIASSAVYAGTAECPTVSIPFKRESASQEKSA